MGALLHADFASVRIHSDPAANAYAGELGARAVTHGLDIFFGAGEYAPDTRAGRRVLAHELAHVVQGRGSAADASAPGVVEPQSSRAEAEARRAGALASFGLPAGRIGAAIAGPALTPTSAAVEPLISYSAGDWAVTEAEERQVIALLSADRDLSGTVLDLHAAGMLEALLDRVDEPANRRDLLRLLGATLNATARAVVQPIVQDLEVNQGWRSGIQLQYNLGRLGVTGTAAPFNRSSYADLVNSGARVPFSGVGATGVSPTEQGYSDWFSGGSRAFERDFNPLGGPTGDLPGYLAGLTPSQRRRQAELLVKQPISTVFEDSYAGALPSRLQVMKALGAAHRIEPELIAAVVLAEQRDQSRSEDARDFIGGFVLDRNTSVGLGQVVGTTARRNDLFADVLTNESSRYAAVTARANVDQGRTTFLLASDEVNIAATARYIRIVADKGARKSGAALPSTRAAFPGIDLAAYANHSSSWPEDNVGALGMYYTSKDWTDDVRSRGWGRFVLEAYRDVKSARLF